MTISILNRASPDQASRWTWGHNGIKSVIDTIGTPQFVRVKIGIGRPAPRQDSADYVLQEFTREEIEILNPCLDRAVDALECLIHRGVAVAMNEFNVREKREDERKPGTTCSNLHDRKMLVTPIHHHSALWTQHGEE